MKTVAPVWNVKRSRRVFKQKATLPLLATIVFLLVAQFFMKPPVNWNPSFSYEDEIPYGTDALFLSLDSLFPGQPVYINHDNLYLSLSRYGSGANLFIIDTELKMDDEESAALFNWVRRGGQAFISLSKLSAALRDSFKIVTDMTFSSADSIHLHTDDNLFLRAATPISFYVSSFDSGRVSAAGYGAPDKTIFIKAAYGKGLFYLHLQPYAYANYNLLLRGSVPYVQKTLGLLPLRPLIWDEYHKNAKQQIVQTPMRYILSETALRAAWFILLALVALFLLFGGRRRQKAIPVLVPPKNESGSYLKTLGRFSMRRTQPLSLIKLKKKLALAWLRQHYGIDGRALDKELIRELSRRNILDENEARNWVMAMAMAGKKRDYSTAELIRLAGIIQKIYIPRTHEKAGKNELKHI